MPMLNRLHHCYHLPSHPLYSSLLCTADERVRTNKVLSLLAPILVWIGFGYGDPILTGSCRAITGLKKIDYNDELAYLGLETQRDLGYLRRHPRRRVVTITDLVAGGMRAHEVMLRRKPLVLGGWNGLQPGPIYRSRVPAVTGGWRSSRAGAAMTAVAAITALMKRVVNCILKSCCLFAENTLGLTE